jgi:hypothetical protein
MEESMSAESEELEAYDCTREAWFFCDVGADMTIEVHHSIPGELSIILGLQFCELLECVRNGELKILFMRYFDEDDLLKQCDARTLLCRLRDYMPKEVYQANPFARFGATDEIKIDEDVFSQAIDHGIGKTEFDYSEMADEAR